jgi:hypothetical protein
MGDFATSSVNQTDPTNQNFEHRVYITIFDAVEETPKNAEMNDTEVL